MKKSLDKPKLTVEPEGKVETRKNFNFSGIAESKYLKNTSMSKTWKSASF